MTKPISRMYPFKFFNPKLNIFQINGIFLEEKHSNSLVNTFVSEQEKESEGKRNDIKLLEAEIELLTSQTNTIISSNTQTAQSEAADERATKTLGKFWIFNNFQNLKVWNLMNTKPSWKRLNPPGETMKLIRESVYDFWKFFPANTGLCSGTRKL